MKFPKQATVDLTDVFVEVRDAYWFQSDDTVYWSYNRDQLLLFLRGESDRVHRLNCEVFSDDGIVHRSEIYGRLVAFCYDEGSVDVFSKARELMEPAMPSSCQEASGS